MRGQDGYACPGRESQKQPLKDYAEINIVWASAVRTMPATCVTSKLHYGWIIPSELWSNHNERPRVRRAWNASEQIGYTASCRT